VHKYVISAFELTTYSFLGKQRALKKFMKWWDHNDRVAGVVVGPLGFERSPHGDGIANSVTFYAAIFPFSSTRFG